MKKGRKKEKMAFLLGNGLESILLRLYQEGKFLEVLGLIEDAKCGDMLAILERRAHIEGDNLVGFTIVFDDEQEMDAR